MAVPPVITAEQGTEEQSAICRSTRRYRENREKKPLLVVPIDRNFRIELSGSCCLLPGNIMELWNNGKPSFREDTILYLFPALHSSLRTYRQISLEVVGVSFLAVKNEHFHLPFLLGSSSFTNMKAARLSIVTDTRTNSVMVSSRV